MDDSLKEKIRIQVDYETLSKNAAEHIFQLIQSTLKDQDIFSLALAGGGTPAKLYELLGSLYAERISWEKVYLFWGDERNVPHDHQDSNYRSAKEQLLDKIEIPAGNIFPVPVAPASVTTAAQEYENRLREFFQTDLPEFDLILLGIGDDGHTASLFPGSEALNEEKKWVAPSMAPDEPKERITLTFPVLNNAKNVYFLVRGKSKSAAVNNALSDNGGKNVCPAAYVQPETGEVLWWLDTEAAIDIQHRGLW